MVSMRVKYLNISLCCRKDLVRGYEDHNIPLDVLVTDMDWHITFHKEDSAGKKDQVSKGM